MNSESSYVVIAIPSGDGCESGNRVWSERFKTRPAAERARLFFTQKHIDVWIVEDCDDVRGGPLNQPAIRHQAPSDANYPPKA